MKKQRDLGFQAMTLCLAGVMLATSVGCTKTTTTSGTTTSTMNAATVKTILQGVLTAASVALGLLAGPGAATEVSAFTTTGNTLISQWQVGTNWKANVLAMLPTLATAAANIVPKCADSSKCQLVVTVLVAGLNTVESDLKGPGSRLNPRRWFEKNQKTYDNFEAFREDWNRDAPATAQLPTLAEMVAKCGASCVEPRQTAGEGSPRPLCPPGNNCTRQIA